VLSSLASLVCVVNVAPEPNAPRAEPTGESPDRRALRARLLADRDAFVASAGSGAAAAALSQHLRDAVARLEPTCLGLYWPVRSEFNAAATLVADPGLHKVARALPFARRVPKSLEFRRWDGAAPTVNDECGIPSSAGAAVVPDVVIVPCVGFTAAGHRLGYGGGYYDRWLAGHPHVVAVGVAWSRAEIDLATFAARPHDVPLAFVVTELGVGAG
jgi:5,10-methenyltetrahydrofolate synthetase